MKKIIKYFVMTCVCLTLSIGALTAATETFTLKTKGWGGWGDPSTGVKKEDNNNGWFKKTAQSAWADNYADAYYDNKRASNTYYNLSLPGMDGLVWFSYVGLQNSVFNGKYVQCRVGSSNTDPNPGSVTLKFAP